MSRSDLKLDVTLEQLGRMYRALADLNAERDKYSDAWFAVMAEGPLDEIRRLEADLSVLTGRSAMEDADAELWLRIEGHGIGWPQAPASVLTQVVDTLRKGVQSVAEWLSDGNLSMRPTKELHDACDLRVVAFQSGSLRVGLRLPDAPEPTDSALGDHGLDVRTALEKYLAGVVWAGGHQSIESLSHVLSDSGLRRVVLSQVSRLAPRLRGRVHTVDISGRALGRNSTIRLSREAHARLGKALDAILFELKPEIYEGDLREIDLDGRSFILRNVAHQNERFAVECEFGPELDRTALDALDRRVSVSGTRDAALRRRGGKLKVLQLDVLDSEASPDSG